jgi:branched-chain amino acid transport system ATP-binding protein
MLEIDNLSVAYGGLHALSGVSLVVTEGQFVAIVGPNGAGKTTLFKAISGTVVPISGCIMYEGRDLLSVPPSRRAHLGIAHVPEGRQVFGALSVLENLEMGALPQSGSDVWGRNIERISRCSRSLPNAAISSREPSPAGSSRCWRSAAGSPPHRG